MNKYQKVINQISKINMHHNKFKTLCLFCGVKNTFRYNRRMTRIAYKGFMYYELLKFKNDFRRNLTHGN